MDPSREKIRDLIALISMCLRFNINEKDPFFKINEKSLQANDLNKEGAEMLRATLNKIFGMVIIDRSTLPLQTRCGQISTTLDSGTYEQQQIMKNMSVFRSQASFMVVKHSTCHMSDNNRNNHTPQSVGPEALDEHARAQGEPDNAGLALELGRQREHPGEKDVVLLKPVSLFERKGSVQEGVGHDETAADIVYSMLRGENGVRGLPHVRNSTKMHHFSRERETERETRGGGAGGLGNDTDPVALTRFSSMTMSRLMLPET